MREVLFNSDSVLTGCRRPWTSQRDRHLLQPRPPSELKSDLSGTQLPSSSQHFEAQVIFRGARFPSNGDPDVNFPVRIRNMR
jgi:hypothetical protein